MKYTFKKLLFCAVVAFTLMPTERLQAHISQKEGISRTARKARSAVFTQLPGMRKIVVWQKTMQRRMAAYLKTFKEHFSFGILLLLAGLVFLYGAVHALGPGHGKIILGSCVIGQQYQLRDVLKASGIFSIVHNGSAILLYSAFILFFGVLKRRTSHDITTAMYNVSGILLVILGVVLLVSLFCKDRLHSHLPERISGHSLTLACATAGLVPCPGALVILLFSSTLGMMWLGYVLALAFAAGMFLTLSLVAILFTSGRKLATVPVKSELVFKVLKGVGAGLLVLIGIHLVILY